MLILHRAPSENKKILCSKNVLAKSACLYLSEVFGLQLQVKNYPKGSSALLSIKQTIDLISLCILENTRSGMIIVFDYRDSAGISQTLSIFEDREYHPVSCIFKYQYNPRLQYKKFKVFPFTYVPSNYERMESIRKRLHILPKRSRKPSIVFMGSPTSPIRASLFKKAQLFSDPWVIHNRRQLNLPNDQYLEEIMKSRYVLSLRGHGNNCYREIEAFGLGTPVIAPEFLNTYSNPLVPDYHYISVSQTDDILELKGEIEDKIRKINSKMYRDISYNALSWYKKNVEIPTAMRHIIKDQHIDWIYKSFIEGLC